MKLVDVDGEALEEIREAVAWYEEQQDDVGRQFGDAVAVVLENLPQRRLKPLRGFEHLRMQFVDVGKPWPYRVLVVDLPSSLWVVALVHERRQPGYWAPRLSR